MAPSSSIVERPLPIVVAPMAGGPTTTELVIAGAVAGGFGFLAAGYLTPSALAEQIATVRVAGVPFGVNLFVPSPTAVDAEEFAAYAARLQPDADRYGLVLDPEPVVDDDGWDAKLALLLDDPVPVVSLTFGLAEPEAIAALRRAGTSVLATVTTVGEAELAAAAGVDGLVVQGPAAGGHSGAFDPDPSVSAVTPTVATSAATVAAVGHVIDAVGLPVVAAGGVDGPASVRRLLDAGAVAVAAGTVFLRCDEAGTNAVHRAALTDERFAATVVTRSFTGRPARALRNEFVDRHDADAPSGYPAVHHLTRPLRRAAIAAGDAERVHLWAGTGYRAAPTGSAGDIVAWLAGRS